MGRSEIKPAPFRCNLRPISTVSVYVRWLYALGAGQWTWFRRWRGGRWEQWWHSTFHSEIWYQVCEPGKVSQNGRSTLISPHRTCHCLLAVEDHVGKT